MKLTEKEKKYIDSKVNSVHAILGGLLLGQITFGGDKVHYGAVNKATKHIEKLILQVYRKGKK